MYLTESFLNLNSISFGWTIERIKFPFNVMNEVEIAIARKLLLLIFKFRFILYKLGGRF